MKKFPKILALVLLLLLLEGCSDIVVGVCVQKAVHTPNIEVKISDTWYILPKISIDQWDSLNIGDTILVNTKTLTIIK